MKSAFFPIVLWFFTAGIVFATTDNLILITVENLRADRLGCYGYMAAEARHIDQIALEGGALKTSSNLSRNFPLPLVNNWNRFSKILQERAFVTATFGEKITDEDLITQEFLQWLKTNQDQRFFGWIRFSASKRRDLRPGVQHKSVYDLQVTYIDYQIGRIRDALVRFNLLSKTAMVITTTSFRNWEKSRAELPLVVAIPGDKSSAQRISSKSLFTDLLKALKIPAK